ncbi:MAG: formyl transferase [Azoarcus sp.]|nr:formyl transferase [Azoarcus sp.]
MRCTVIGSRYFGATVLANLLEDGMEVVRVVAPAEDDRLAVAAAKAGLPLSILESPRTVPGSALQEDCDLIIAAHTHAFVTEEALARAKIGGIGYHPSLLPRHRGIAAVEWTLLEGDPIAGGSIYHLEKGWDDGAIAAQDWCFVLKGESARDLWERALCPLGLNLVRKVVRHAAEHGTLPAEAQDARFATRAPMIRRTVKLVEQESALTTSLVVTVIGPDKPGIVRKVSDCAQAAAVNWADSHMTSVAGQFAGIVHLQVAPDDADTVIAALRKLEDDGLSIAIARSDARPVPAGRRLLRLELAGPDRPGIVRRLSTSLAERGVSIENLDTEIVGERPDEPHVFKVHALLVVPEALADETLREMLDGLGHELMVDIALDTPAHG